MLNSQAQKTLYGLMDLLYPIGSYYITESSSLDTVDKMNAYFGGTWERLEDGRFLEAGSSIADKSAGLPNIIGSIEKLAGNTYFPTDISVSNSFYLYNTGSHKVTGESSSKYTSGSLGFDASRMNNSLYGKSSTVQPKSRVVYIYRRATLSGGHNISKYISLFIKEECKC